MMKKIIIVLLAFMLLTAPVAKAQLVDPVVIEQQLKIQLIDLIKQVIAMLQEQIKSINQQTAVTQQLIETTKPLVIEEVKPTAVAPIIGKYSHFVYDINITPLEYKQEAIVTIKLFDVNGVGIPNKEVIVRQHRCHCSDQPIQTQYGYMLETKSNEAGEVKFNILAYNKMNNFISVQVLNEPIKWIAIPTSFENQIWNWSEKDGGYFNPK